MKDWTGDDPEPAAACQEDIGCLGTSCWTSSWKGEGTWGKRTEQHANHHGLKEARSILRSRGGTCEKQICNDHLHLDLTHLQRVSPSLGKSLRQIGPCYPSLAIQSGLLMLARWKHAWTNSALLLRAAGVAGAGNAVSRTQQPKGTRILSVQALQRAMHRGQAEMQNYLNVSLLLSLRCKECVLGMLWSSLKCLPSCPSEQSPLFLWHLIALPAQSLNSGGISSTMTLKVVRYFITCRSSTSVSATFSPSWSALVWMKTAMTSQKSTSKWF